MATTNIYFGKITDDALVMLSNYHKAEKVLRALREEFNKERKKLDEQVEEVRTKRRQALDEGMDSDKVTETFPLEPIFKAQNALQVKFVNDCEPHKNAQKDALALIDNGLYYGYLLAQAKGSFDCKGKVAIKSGKKNEEVYVEKSYKGMIEDFLGKIGAKNTADKKALNKFVTGIAVCTSGKIKASKGDHYIKDRSASQYKALFMSTLLEEFIVNKGVLVVNEDNTLSRKVQAREEEVA